MDAPKQLAKRAISRFGYRLQRIDQLPDRQRFDQNRAEILRRHRSQTLESVTALTERYREPVFGEIRVWELFPILARCIDPTDPSLGCASQLTHTLQVVEAMQDDGMTDTDLLLCALIHDLGKTLLATDEDPANVVGKNVPIGSYDEGIGFDRCTFQWNHGEFAYSRFRDLVPDHVAWLIRYHGVKFDRDEVQRVMDERDRHYTEQYYGMFSQYDSTSKAMFGTPRTRIEDYRDLIERAFPAPIPF